LDAIAQVIAECNGRAPFWCSVSLCSSIDT
jgi:hypothetical protein